VFRPHICIPVLMWNPRFGCVTRTFALPRPGSAQLSSVQLGSAQLGSGSLLLEAVSMGGRSARPTKTVRGWRVAGWPMLGARCWVGGAVCGEWWEGRD
jgi:hypothetical protein